MLAFGLGARNQFPSPSVSADKTPPHNHMLVGVHPAFYLLSYILPRDPQGGSSPTNWWSALCCEVVGIFISTYRWVSGDPEQSHRMPDGSVIQRLLTLLYQRGRCFGSHKGFQSALTVRANTDVFLPYYVYTNFLCPMPGWHISRPGKS